MPKIAGRPLSRYTAEALRLLGEMIRAGRIERQMTGEELATRAGISRPLLRRIEAGDPGCSVGAVFEAATLAGVALFDTDREGIADHRAVNRERLRLLPKSVQRSRRKIDDDF